MITITGESADDRSIHISALGLSGDKYRQIAQQIRALGGTIDFSVYPGAIHGHVPITREAYDWLKKAGEMSDDL